MAPCASEKSKKNGSDPKSENFHLSWSLELFHLKCWSEKNFNLTKFSLVSFILAWKFQKFLMKASSHATDNNEQTINIFLFASNHSHTQLTVLGFPKTNGNHFAARFWSSCDTSRSNVFIKSNRWLQSDQSDVVVFLVALILRMWCDGTDINNLSMRAVIMNINATRFHNDRISALSVVLAMCSFGKQFFFEEFPWMLSC